MQWTYRGTVKWTPVYSPPVATNVQWVMEVLDVATNAAVRASIVRGFPDQLMGEETGFAPSVSVVLCVSNRVYRLPAANEKEASRLAQRLVSAPLETPRDAEEFLVLPLHKGQTWGGGTEREDHWYCWHVESEKLATVRLKGIVSPRRMPIWRVAYRTCPEHEIMEIAQGIGITRYVYEHHGTVGSVDVRMVEIKRRGN